MRALLFSAFLLAPAIALAESTDPVPTPTPEAAGTPAMPATSPTPVAAPTPAPAASATPEPSGTPGWAAAVPASTPALRPHRDPRGWDVEAAVHSQGVFDGGIHVFSEDSWLTGAELRVRRLVTPSDAAIEVSPELSYGVAHNSRLYPASSSTELWLQRYSAGVRTSVRIDRFLPRVHPFARAGVTGLWSTALAHTPYRDHREEAYSWGAYGSAGLQIDLENLVGRLLRPGQRVYVGFEAGHLYSPGLDFGRMGRLDLNAAFLSAQLTARF